MGVKRKRLAIPFLGHQPFDSTDALEPRVLGGMFRVFLTNDLYLTPSPLMKP